MIKSKRFGMVALVIIVCWGGIMTHDGQADALGRVDDILQGIETRYAGTGFSADFFQESILKAMRITDTAEGRLTVKRPGKMRWEYVLPEQQTIVSDGDTMWIYRPADNQVMLGKAPVFFGDGKGAGFLADIRQIRANFALSLQPAESENHFRLQLVPHQPTAELADIVLSVDKGTHRIDQVVTHNIYGDETRIMLRHYRFNIDPADDLFAFTVPDGADIVQMDSF